MHPIKFAKEIAGLHQQSRSGSIRIINSSAICRGSATVSLILISLIQGDCRKGDVWGLGSNAHHHQVRAAIVGDGAIVVRCNAEYDHASVGPRHTVPPCHNVGLNRRIDLIDRIAVAPERAAAVETYQREDGSIAVPDVLQPYMGGLKVIEKD